MTEPTVKLAYKVVTRYRSGAYCSFAWGSYEEDTPWVTKYEINEWTLPRIAGSRLYCFDRLSNAKKFLNFAGRLCDRPEDRKIQIFLCEIQDPVPTPVCHDDFSTYDTFWEQFNAGTFHTSSLIIQPVTGSISGIAVKLLERVPRW